MAIEKLIDAPNGAPIAYHQVNVLTVDYPAYGDALPTVFARVNSWKDYAAYQAKAPIGWQWYLDGVLGVAEFADPEQGLIDNLASPFVGGLIVDYSTPTVEASRLRKLVEISKLFNEKNNESLMTPYGLVDGDDASKIKVTQAVTLWQALDRLEQAPATIDFTMFDYSQVTVTPVQLDTIGAMLGSREQTLRGIRNTLRTEVAEATTVEEVLAIAWPLPPMP